jgi:hypothetical protein
MLEKWIHSQSTDNYSSIPTAVTFKISLFVPFNAFTGFAEQNPITSLNSNQSAYPQGHFSVKSEPSLYIQLGRISLLKGSTTWPHHTETDAQPSPLTHLQTYQSTSSFKLTPTIKMVNAKYARTLKHLQRTTRLNPETHSTQWPPIKWYLSLLSELTGFSDLYRPIRTLQFRSSWWEVFTYWDRLVLATQAH